MKGPAHSPEYLATARQVSELVDSLPGRQLLQVLDGRQSLESVTILKPSAVGPTIPPSLFRGQVQG